MCSPQVCDVSFKEQTVREHMSVFGISVYRVPPLLMNFNLSLSKRHTHTHLPLFHSYVERLLCLEQIRTTHVFSLSLFLIIQSHYQQVINGSRVGWDYEAERK